MPPKPLTPEQKALQARLDAIIETAKNDHLRKELIPLADKFREAAALDITTKHLAAEIIAHHPKFKEQPERLVVNLIDDLLKTK